MDAENFGTAAWNPLQDEVCRECSILPLCAGGCPQRFLQRDPTLGEDFRPCPTWKFQLEAKVKSWAADRGVFPVEHET